MFSKLLCCSQVAQQGKEVLCVSQFTLFNIMKGNKPDFHLAMAPAPVCTPTAVSARMQFWSLQ